MPQAPRSKLTITMKDHSSQNGSSSLYIPNLTVLDTAALLAARLGFEAAVRGISTGSHQSSILSDTNIGDASGLPADNNDSIIKNRMVFKYRDTVDPTIKGSTSVPASDNQWEIQGTNDVDITALPVAAMISVINTTGTSVLGNLVEVYKVEMQK